MYIYIYIYVHTYIYHIYTYIYTYTHTVTEPRPSHLHPRVRTRVSSVENHHAAIHLGAGRVAPAFVSYSREMVAAYHPAAPLYYVCTNSSNTKKSLKYEVCAVNISAPAVKRPSSAPVNKRKNGLKINPQFALNPSTTWITTLTVHSTNYKIRIHLRNTIKIKRSEYLGAGRVATAVAACSRGRALG